MNSIPDDGSFWASLYAFWKKDRIDQWKKILFTKKKTEVCENLITLAPSVHKYWGAALFALKPLDVAADGKSMDLQFFWLRPYKRPTLVPLSIPPELPADLQGSVEDVKLFDCKTERKICSGDKFTLHTDDPQNKPLPSPELLQMQWILHRLSALSGAAEVFDPYYDSDDGDDAFEFPYLNSLEEFVELEEPDDMEEEINLRISILSSTHAILSQ